MKKVMVVIPALGSGGGERLAVSLIAKMNPQNISTRLVILYPYQDTENARFAMASGIDTIYLNKHRGFDIKIVSKLKKEIKRFAPDIIQTHLYTVSYVLLAAPRKKIKYHTVHNVAEKEAYGMRRLITYIAFRFGNFVPIAISPYCAKTIEDVYHIESSKFPCIVNGVDIEKYRPEPESHAEIRFINVGRLQTQKNQALLIKAFKKVHEEKPNTKLKIVGEGELRPELEMLVKKMKLEDSVDMPGQSSEVQKELNSADIYVQSSDFEGLPISVLEAMACGLPIISTKAGGTVDIVHNDENGFLVDVDDEDGFVEKMRILSANYQMRKKMGQTSRKIVLDYSIEECARKYEELYINS